MLHHVTSSTSVITNIWISFSSAKKLHSSSINNMAATKLIAAAAVFFSVTAFAQSSDPLVLIGGYV
jgi:hypothetical protein